MAEPLLSLFAEPTRKSEIDCDGLPVSDLLEIDKIRHSRLVDRSVHSLSANSATKYTKVLNETRDDE